MIPTFSVLVPVCFFPSFAIGVHLRRQLIRFRTRQTTSTLFGLPMLFDYVFYLRPYKGVKPLVRTYGFGSAAAPLDLRGL
jgi:hypothetical protein